MNNKNIENTGKTKRRGKTKVMVDGTVYDNLAACAEALQVDTKTLREYLRGNRKRSVLQGMDIRIVE